MRKYTLPTYQHCAIRNVKSAHDLCFYLFIHLFIYLFFHVHVYLFYAQRNRQWSTFVFCIETRHLVENIKTCSWRIVGRGVAIIFSFNRIMYWRFDCILYTKSILRWQIIYLLFSIFDLLFFSPNVKKKKK